MPVKGKWRDSILEMQEWLGALHMDTARQLANRVVEAFYQSSDNSTKTKYLIMSGVAGFLNCNMGLRRANATLEWDPTVTQP